jgi:Spy/CpxP family protein refolding chaperone
MTARKQQPAGIMKISKVSLLAILAVGSLTTFGTLAQAQDASTNAPSTNAPAAPQGGAGGGARLAKLDAKLGLTGATETQFNAIMTDQMQQMKDLRGDDSLTPEDKKAKMKDIRDAANAKIKALLTPDQYTQYLAATKKQHKPKNTDGGTNAPSATPPPAPQN